MPRSTVLITGGAGFIGSHLADDLLAQGYAVRVLDTLCPQVHGQDQPRPGYLSGEVDLHVGDVCDPEAVRRALEGVDAVFHLAAAVGVGQSMYEIANYTRINNMGTAVLLEALMQQPVGRLVVASSMSIYGEGLYRSADGMPHRHVHRLAESLAAGQWDPTDNDGAALIPMPTPESKTPTLSSVYALSKYDQERMCLIFGQAYHVPVVALRFFNVYGPRQALSNPYTGVLAIFASRLLNDRAPLIFEDGQQQRDFVHVSDIARACRQALETTCAEGEVFNIGSGSAITVRALAEQFAGVLGKGHIEPDITGQYRVGDIRHCFADISRARAVLGYQPQISLQRGMLELAEWLEGQIAIDRVDDARAELARRGLTVKAA